jgi:hypothetical protein
MKNSIKRRDWKCHSDESNAECNTRVGPPTYIVPEVIEHKRSGAVVSERYQGNDRHDKEYNMADATNHLQGVQHATKPEVPDHRKDNESPHYESSMPSLRLIVRIVENN